MGKKRLAKYLAAAGVGSRRACEQIVRAGQVTVNGSVVLLPQTCVDESDCITVNGHRCQYEESKVYFILNKPKGYLCSSKRTGKRQVVLDLFEEIDERLFTVGRLDKDTTGLLLVTNDGHFAHRVIHPSSNLKKEYVAKTGQEITGDHLKAISSGIMMEGTFVKPKKVKKVRKGTLKIVISEGKKREVRRLIENAGLTIKELKRTRIGGLPLGNLPLGNWRPMTDKEKAVIFGEWKMASSD